ncbi:MAG: DoxX family protein [Steroidobacteraceae bacterium]
MAATPDRVHTATPWRALAAALAAALRRLGWLATAIAPPLMRVALAVPFFRSGLTKWDGWLALSPAAQYLFEQQFKLHLFGHLYAYPFPDILAYIDGVAEIALPVLLVIGLATRLSALGLLIMVAVIQLTVPSAWANFHLPWAGLAVGILALGPGALSLDRLLVRIGAARR